MKPDPQMERHVVRIYAEPQYLFEAGEAVESLMNHPGWLHVTRLLEWEIATVDATLDGRREPMTQAEYAMWHGRRGGLRAFQEAADAIVAISEREYQRQAQRHEGDAEPSLNGG